VQPNFRKSKAASRKVRKLLASFEKVWKVCRKVPEELAVKMHLVVVAVVEHKYRRHRHRHHHRAVVVLLHLHHLLRHHRAAVVLLHLLRHHRAAAVLPHLLRVASRINIKPAIIAGLLFIGLIQCLVFDF
jgi:hypothetical protein